MCRSCRRVGGRLGTLVVAVKGGSDGRNATVLTSLCLLGIKFREILDETKLLASHDGNNANHRLAYMSASYLLPLSIYHHT